jgi:hypothetical protein
MRVGALKEETGVLDVGVGSGPSSWPYSLKSLEPDFSHSRTKEVGYAPRHRNLPKEVRKSS